MLRDNQSRSVAEVKSEEIRLMLKENYWDHI
jgi:hypothetical protein